MNLEEENAFGSVADKHGNLWICTHGGSQWLCPSCARAILINFPDNSRIATKSEREIVRTWENSKRGFLSRFWWQLLGVMK